MPICWMHAFVDVPDDLVTTAHTFWAGATGCTVSEQWPGHPQFVSLLPPHGSPYLHVQRIDGPPRVHLDLVGDIAEHTERLVTLGASVGHRGEAWQVMSSPAGLAFCVCDEPEPHHRGSATTWTDGNRSRLVQLCVDVPTAAYDEEFAFWQQATGWQEEPVRSPEFRRLVHRDESALQLLVQRLGADDDATAARAHLDLGTDDIPAEVARLGALGASQLWPGNGFVAMRDPNGMPFCVTGNDPDR